MSKGFCVPYTPLQYSPMLWAEHIAAVRAPAPAPQMAPVAALPPAPVPAPSVAPPHPPVAAPGVPPLQAPVLTRAGQDLALGPAPQPSLGVAGRAAEIESAQAAADAVPPVAKAPAGESGQLGWFRTTMMMIIVEEVHRAIYCQQGLT